MRIAITGSTGFVGKAATSALREAGHVVVRIVRHPGQQPETVLWRPDTGEVDTQALGEIDALIHLAGENVAAGRWTKQRRSAIADSRGPATERLCSTLAALPKPPAVMVSASATGIYGDRGDEELNEHSTIGHDFLADVAAAWEAATQPLANAGTRVVNLRIGVVLDRSGGALQRMLLPFRLGIGGRLGSGKQWMSWISLHDLVRVITRAIDDPTLRGPVLATAPTPVTNREFTRTLGKALRRPTVLPVPRLLLRLLFGEMADALLLASQRARPQRLLATGFEFEHTNLEMHVRSQDK